MLPAQRIFLKIMIFEWLLWVNMISVDLRHSLICYTVHFTFPLDSRAHWAWSLTRTPSGGTSWMTSAVRWWSVEWWVMSTVWWPGPGVRILCGRGQWLSAVPRVLPRGLPWRPGGDDQVELHLPQRDDIRPGNPVNIKVALHMKISQSARLFICNFKSESSPVIVQLIHQADGRTIKWAPWKNVLFSVCNWIWPQCNDELSSQYFSRIMIRVSVLGGSCPSWKLLNIFLRVKRLTSSAPSPWTRFRAKRLQTSMTARTH